MDGAYLAVLANQIFLSQPQSHIERYYTLVKREARKGLTNAEYAELLALSPVQLLSDEIEMPVAQIEALIRDIRPHSTGERDEIYYKLKDAEERGLFDEYDLDIPELEAHADRVNEILRTYPQTGAIYFLETQEGKHEFSQAVAEARVDLDLLEQEASNGNPIYYVLGDLTFLQEERVLQGVKDRPFGWNTLFSAYGDDIESGAWFGTDVYESEVWAWFRELYE